MKRGESVDYLLVGALVEGPRHGYEILQFLEEHFDLAWYVGTSQLYTVLRRLERKGFVTARIEPQESRPAKRVFSLTSSGRARFSDWIDEPVQHVRDMRIEFMGKLFFARCLGKERSRRLVALQREVLLALAEKINERLRGEKEPFRRLVLASKQSSVGHWLNWLEQSALPHVEALKGD